MIELKAPSVGVGGEWQLWGINRFNGHPRLIQDWHNNIMLTSGLHAMAQQSSWLNYCQVGESGVAPLPSQTALILHKAGTNTINTQFYGAEGGAPYFGWRQKTFWFAEGAAQGNMAEIAAGWGAGPGSDIVSRALTEDISGTTVPATVLPDEILAATYKMNYYPPLDDATGTVNFDGVDYDYIVRAANVTNGDSWGKYIGDEVGPVAGAGFWVAYDDEIQGITQAPLGSPSNSDNSGQSAETYQGAFSRKCLANVGPTGWVLGSGIRSLLCQTTLGQYQIRFGATAGDAPVPKIGTKIMGIGLNLSWAQKV